MDVSSGNDTNSIVLSSNQRSGAPRLASQHVLQEVWSVSLIFVSRLMDTLHRQENERLRQEISGVRVIGIQDRCNEVRHFVAHRRVADNATQVLQRVILERTESMKAHIRLQVDQILAVRSATLLPFYYSTSFPQTCNIWQEGRASTGEPHQLEVQRLREVCRHVVAFTSCNNEFSTGTRQDDS